MEPTTGLILRRITQTELSVSAHKLCKTRSNNGPQKRLRIAVVAE